MARVLPILAHIIFSRDTINEVQVQPLKLQSIFVLLLSIKDLFISINALIIFSFEENGIFTR